MLRHRPALLILGVVCFVFFAGCTYFSYGARTGGPRVAALFAAFALLSAYLLIEYVVARCEVREEGRSTATFSGAAGSPGGRTSRRSATPTA